MSTEQNKRFVKDWLLIMAGDNTEPWKFLMGEATRNDQLVVLLQSLFPDVDDLSLKANYLEYLRQYINQCFYQNRFSNHFITSSNSNKYKIISQLMNNHYLLSQEIAKRKQSTLTSTNSFWYNIFDLDLLLLKVVKHLPVDIILNQLLVNDVLDTIEEQYDIQSKIEYLSNDSFLASISTILSQQYKEKEQQYRMRYAQSQLIKCILSNPVTQGNINIEKLPDQIKAIWGDQIIVRNANDLKYQIINSILERFKVLTELAHLIANELISTEQSDKIDQLIVELSTMIGNKQSKMIDLVQKLTSSEPLDRAAIKQLFKKDFGEITGNVIKKIAQTTGHTYRETKAVFSHLEPYAIWGFNRFPVATIHGNNIQIDFPYKMQLTEEQVEEFKAVKTTKPPKWFATLSLEEKNWVLNNCALIMTGQKICPPAIIRKLPGITNCSLQINVSLNEQKEIIKWDESSLRRHNLTLDIKDTYENARITLQNAKQLFVIADPEKKFKQVWQNTFDAINDKNKPRPFLIDVGALSPLMTFPYVLYDLLFQYGDNNTDMREGQHHAIKSANYINKKFNVVSINLPVNSERAESNGFTDILNLEENNLLINNIYNVFISLHNHPITIQLGLKQLLGDIASQFRKEPIDTDKLNSQLLQLKTTKNDFVKHLKEYKELENSLMKITNITNRRQVRERMINIKKQMDHLDKLMKLCEGFEAIINYIELFNHPDQPDHNNKGLFAAVYLITAVNSFGGTITGGCKSAKDRWGLISILVTAMSIYSNENGTLPVLDKDGNISPTVFIDYFADAYLAGHQQYIAGTNNPGNEGIQEGCGILSKINDYHPMLPHCVKNKIEEKSKNYVFINQVLSKQKHFVPKYPGSWFDSIKDFFMTKWNKICNLFRFNKSTVSSIDVTNSLSFENANRGGSPRIIFENIGTQNNAVSSPDTLKIADQNQILREQLNPTSDITPMGINLNLSEDRLTNKSLVRI